MSLLDTVISGVMNRAQGGGSSGLQSVLTGLLSGGQQQDQNAPAAGGLGGIVSQLEQAGLGHLVQSWVGNGPNQGISPQQLQGAFGQDQVQSMASDAGMAPHDFLSQLASHLPEVVNSLTPHGRLPDDGTISV